MSLASIILSCQRARQLNAQVQNKIAKTCYFRFGTLSISTQTRFKFSCARLLFRRLKHTLAEIRTFCTWDVLTCRYPRRQCRPNRLRATQRSNTGCPSKKRPRWRSKCCSTSVESVPPARCCHRCHRTLFCLRRENSVQANRLSRNIEINQQKLH